MSASLLSQDPSSISSSVPGICDELWNCRDSTYVLERLQNLHRALLKEKVNAYDPSEAFLAIQGAALRFLPSSSCQEELSPSPLSSLPADAQESEEEALHWSITEEALLAAAALACVCVGPAWYAQRKRLRRFYLSRTTSDGDQSTLQSSTVDPPEHVMQQGGGDWRSYSPITDPATSTLQMESVCDELNDEPVPYPRIPEVLPAALLRHADSLLKFIPGNTSQEKGSRNVWDQRRMRIAIAQRHLVLALCFEGSDLGKLEDQRPSGSSDTIVRQWTILGAHELVGRMILFWLSLAVDSSSEIQQSKDEEAQTGLDSSGTPSDSDQWYVLAVARAIVDLISTGWRPIPSSIVPVVIRLLLQIARVGFCSLDSVLDEKLLASGDSALPVTDASLTALSSSAEAISGLAAMGSRFLIHHDAEHDLVVSTCYIHVRARLVKVSLLAQEDYGSTQGLLFPSTEREQFLNQIDSCFADTWELLIALSGSTSCAAPLKALLDVIAISNPRSDTCRLFSKEQWGTQEKLDCLASGTALRVLSAAMWKARRHVNIPTHLRNQMPAHLRTIRELAASIHEILHIRIQDGTFESKSTLDLLSLALDTVVAIGNFCNQQISGGGELISTVEWDLFLLALEEAFLPWFDYEMIAKSLEDVPSEPTRFSQGIKRVLRRSNIEAQSLILRIGALLDTFTRDDGNPFHSIVVYESQRRLYKFILRKVIPVIDPTDGELLGLSVSRAWVKFGLFPFRLCDWSATASEILSEFFRVQVDGRCVFSPSVRLAALVALENSSCQILQSSDDQSNDGRIRASSVPTFPGGLADASDYHAQIMKAMIDVVDASLKALIVVQREGSSSEDHHDPKFLPRSNNSVALNIHLVRLTGAFVRNASVGRDRKVSFLGLLESLATSEPTECASGDTNTNHQGFHSHASIRLETIRELEHCLEEVCGRAPVENWIIPVLMASFCRILKTIHGDQRIQKWTAASTTASLYTIMVLARIRLSCQEGRIILFDWKGSLGDVPDEIKTKLGSFRRPGGRSSTPLKNNEVQGSLSTVPHARISCRDSFEEIVISLVAHIVAARSAESETIDREVMELLQFEIVVCYHSLACLWLSGASSGDKVARLQFLSSCSSKKRDVNEAAFAGRALGAFMECRLTELKATVYENSPSSADAQELELLFTCLLSSFDQDRHVVERTIISRSILVTLPTLSQLNEGRTLLASAFSCLVVILGKQILIPEGRSTIAKQEVTKEENLVFLDLAREILAGNATVIPTNDVTKLFDICVAMTGTNYFHHSTPGFHFALRCLATIIEVLPVTGVMLLKERYLQNSSQVQEPEDSHASPWKEVVISTKFLPQFVREICDQRLYFSEYSELSTESFEQAESKEGFDLLDDLAIEIDRMEKFEVESLEDSGKKMISNWYDEDCDLLTLRIGSSKSSFRGWVEVVIRSPSRRTRRIYRLPSGVSLQDPHGASSLWAQRDIVGSDPTYHLKLPPKLSPGFSDDKVQQDYESLIARFDVLMSPSVSDIQVEPPEAEGTPLNVDDADMDRGQDNHIFTTEIREVSSENIEEWLIRSLGDGASANVVLQGIQKLGFSHFSKSFQSDHTSKQRTTRPFLKQLRPGQKTDRSITVLDRTIPCNTHKIGLLYAGPSGIGSSRTDSETELLSNQHCSPAFHKFAAGLGSMVLTKNLRFFSGGLDVSSFESDGHFARVWVDKTSDGSNLQAARTIVVYHVPSLMPPGVNNRKRHIGNDIVLIVFHDTGYDGVLRADGEEVNPLEPTESVVSGHFNFVTIHVTIMPKPIFARVTVRLRKGLPEGLHQTLVHCVGINMVHIDDTPAFVRRIAIQADLVCRAMLDNLAPASNTYERYKMLSLMGRHAID